LPAKLTTLSKRSTEKRKWLLLRASSDLEPLVF
jgi:hypothetical protein